MFKALIFVGFLTATTFGQGFGGGGLGGGFGFGGNTGDQNVVQSQDCMIVVAKSREFVTAFSARTGKTSKLELEKAPEQIVPVVGANMACFIVGNDAYAFAVDSGKWLHIKIKGEGPHNPVVSNNMVQVWTDEAIYICSATSKEWQIMER